MTRKNFLGGLIGAASLLFGRARTETTSLLAGGFVPRDQLPPREIRANQNITLLLRDGREIEGWYDSTGFYYGIGLMCPIDREVVAWQLRPESRWA